MPLAPPGDAQGVRGVPTDSPQMAGSGGEDHKIPRTKRHFSILGGMVANMATSALTSLYAGSAGLTRLPAGTLPAMTELLVSGRSAVRSRSPAPGPRHLAAEDALTLCDRREDSSAGVVDELAY